MKVMDIHSMPLLVNILNVTMTPNRLTKVKNIFFVAMELYTTNLLLLVTLISSRIPKP